MAMAKFRIEADLKEIKKHPLEGILCVPDEENAFEWDTFIEGPSDSIFEKGIWHCRIIFPENYPEMPPVVKFISDFWHPNVYEDGKVCASILHKPGKDEFNELESARERWLPIHTISTVLNCLLLVLQEPGGAPANVDANRQWKNDWEGYKKRLSGLCAKSAKEFKEKYPNLEIPHPVSDPQENDDSEEDDFDPIDIDDIEDDDSDEDEDEDEDDE